MEKTKTKESKSSVSPIKKSPAKSGNTNGQSYGKGESNESSLMEEFLLNSIKDIYWAEKHLLKALPKLGKAATSVELKESFTQHIEITKEQVSRLEEAFAILGKKPQAKKCDAMEGLTKEAESIIEETEKGTMTRDAGLIMAAQKVEHYEIATYGGLKQLAKTLGKNDLSELFDQTLTEEKQADELLSTIAESKINIEAVQE